MGDVQAGHELAWSREAFLLFFFSFLFFFFFSFLFFKPQN